MANRRKRNKRNPDGKRRSKALTVCNDMILYIENPKDTIRKLLELICVRLFASPWTTAGQASLSITNYQSLLKFMSIKWVMPFNHFILCRPFFSCLQSFPASGSFPMSQLFASSGQSVGVSASTSVPPVKQAKFDVIQIGLISMSKGRICPFGCKVYLVSPGSCVCEKKYRLLLFFSN